MNFEKLTSAVDASVCALRPSDGDSIPASSGSCVREPEFASAGDLPPIFQQQSRWINALHRPFAASSEDFLKLAQLADSDNDALVRRHAEFFDGCHWLALGNIQEAGLHFQKVRNDVPEADVMLKEIESHHRKQVNLAALQAWEIYNREAEARQVDLDQGFLAKAFSTPARLALTREKRFVPERRLIQELRRRIEAGESASLSAGLEQIGQSGLEDLRELAAYLLSKEARSYVGDPRPALVEFASESNLEKTNADLLLQRTSELDHQSRMPETCAAIKGLVEKPRSQDIGREGSLNEQFAAGLLRLLTSSSLEEVAADFSIMAVSAGIGNAAKLLAFQKMKTAGVAGHRILAGGAGVLAESSAYFLGNSAKEASLHDPAQVMKAEEAAKRFGAGLAMIAGAKGMSSISSVLTVNGRAAHHALGLGGMVLGEQLSQELGWQESPEGGFVESLTGDVFAYAKFAVAAHAVQSAGLETAAIPPATKRSADFRHPIFAPLWACMGAGGVGGSGRSKQVLENLKNDPSNQEMRSVYADVLLEEGDSRGELIHLQMSDDMGMRTWRRESKLKAEVREKLRGNYLRVHRLKFDRGFISSLHFGNSNKSAISYLGASPDAPFIREISTQYLSQDSLQTLLNDPLAGNLKILKLREVLKNQASGDPIGDEGARMLAQCANLENLTSLSLVKCEISGGISYLTNSPYLQNLQSLSLRGNILGTIHQVTEMPKLSYLNLSENGLYDDDVASLASKKADWKLTHLDLFFNRCTADGLTAILQSLNFSGLQFLNLSANPLFDGGVRALASSPRLSNINYLNLGLTEMGAEGLLELAQSPYVSNLRFLNLDANSFESRDVRALAESPNLGNLTHLSIAGDTGSGWKISKEDQEVLRQSPFLRNLRHSYFGPARFRP